LGQQAADLGIAYETYGMDREQMITEAVYGPVTGIRLSEYSFPSSSRDRIYTSRH
jgi:hypothetical protein